jgi:hypothetical protein
MPQSLQIVNYPVKGEFSFFLRGENGILNQFIFKEDAYGQINGRQEGHQEEAGQNRQGKEEGQAGKKEEIGT